MLCSEKDRLLVDEHRQPALVYSRAVITLNRQRAQSPRPEYDQLRQATDDASIKYKEARLASERQR
jgi:hypothetical protein